MSRDGVIVDPALVGWALVIRITNLRTMKDGQSGNRRVEVSAKFLSPLISSVIVQECRFGRTKRTLEYRNVDGQKGRRWGRELRLRIPA